MFYAIVRAALLVNPALLCLSSDVLNLYMSQPFSIVFFFASFIQENIGNARLTQNTWTTCGTTGVKGYFYTSGDKPIAHRKMQSSLKTFETSGNVNNICPSVP